MPAALLRQPGAGGGGACDPSRLGEGRRSRDPELRPPAHHRGAQDHQQAHPDRDGGERPAGQRPHRLCRQRQPRGRAGRRRTDGAVPGAAGRADPGGQRHARFHRARGARKRLPRRAPAALPELRRGDDGREPGAAGAHREADPRHLQALPQPARRLQYLGRQPRHRCRPEGAGQGRRRRADQPRNDRGAPRAADRRIDGRRARPEPAGRSAARRAAAAALQPPRPRQRGATGDAGHHLSAGEFAAGVNTSPVFLLVLLLLSSRPSRVAAQSRDPCGIAAPLTDRMLGWTAPDGIGVPE